MTKFLSKVLLSGILLSSVSGYCQDDEMTIYAGIAPATGENSTNTTKIELNGNFTQNTNLNIGSQWTSGYITSGNNILPSGYSWEQDEDKHVNIYNSSDKNDNTLVLTEKNAGEWTFTNDYEFKHAILDLKGYEFSLDAGKTLKIDEYGKIVDNPEGQSQSGKIQLKGVESKAENTIITNTVTFMQGSMAGIAASTTGTEPTSAQYITIHGSDQNVTNIIDLSNFLNQNGTNNSWSLPDNTSIITDLCLNLTGTHKIKLNSNDYHFETNDNNQNSKENVVFPNIKAGDGSNVTVDAGFEYVVNKDTSNDPGNVLAKIAEYKGNTIGINSPIPLHKIFDVNSGIKLDFGEKTDGNKQTVQSILEELVDTINKTGFSDSNDKVNVDADSFIACDSSIDVLKLNRTVDGTDDTKINHANILVTDYELKMENAGNPFDFKYITVGTIKEPGTEGNKNSANKIIQNAKNAKYLLNQYSTGGVKFQDSENILIEDNNEKTISELTLDNSKVTLKGNINVKTFAVVNSTGSNITPKSVVNIASNSTITLGGSTSTTSNNSSGGTNQEQTGGNSTGGTGEPSSPVELE